MSIMSEFERREAVADQLLDNSEDVVRARTVVRTRVVTWTCCGGIILFEDDKCPVCGDDY